MGQDVKEHLIKNKGKYGTLTVSGVIAIVTLMINHLPTKDDNFQMEKRLMAEIGELGTAIAVTGSTLVDYHKRQDKFEDQLIKHGKEDGHREMKVRMDQKDKVDKEQWERIRFYHGQE